MTKGVYLIDKSMKEKEEQGDIFRREKHEREGRRKEEIQKESMREKGGKRSIQREKSRQEEEEGDIQKEKT